MTSSVSVRDVTLRDGLQDESPITTDAKLALFDALCAAQLRELELTSFVRADKIPALADAEALTAQTNGRTEPVVKWGLVLNLRGAQRALAAGLRHLQFVVSVSEVHNSVNAGRTVAQSVAEFAAISQLVGDAVPVEVTLATAFGCPYLGPIDAGLVRQLASEVAELGASGITLADTIGTAVPTEVARLVTDVTGDHPALPIGVHLHDTRGLALANALAAVEAGAHRLDGAVGGLGGCPFAPGASGNLPLEDLVHALHHLGIETGVDLEKLIEAAHLACALVGRPIRSHVGVAGPRFSALAPLPANDNR